MKEIVIITIFFLSLLAQTTFLPLIPILQYLDILEMVIILSFLSKGSLFINIARFLVALFYDALSTMPFGILTIIFLTSGYLSKQLLVHYFTHRSIPSLILFSLSVGFIFNAIMFLTERLFRISNLGIELGAVSILAGTFLDAVFLFLVLLAQNKMSKKTYGFAV